MTHGRQAGELVEGRYRLDERIGAGSFGEVWRALDTKFDLTVAVKVLVPPPGQEVIPDDDRARFAREAKLTAKFMGKRHIVLVTDYGEFHGEPYLVMPFLHGKDLHALLLAEGRLPPARAVGIVRQIGQALATTHGEGLVHRDVKPSNVFVEAGDEVTLLDFGMVGPWRAGVLTGLTEREEFTGTLMYMGPERLPGEDGADPTAPSSNAGDLYGLACILHECLTGSPAFRGTNLELWIQHRQEQRPVPGGDLGEFDDVVRRGLARSPHDRQGSVADLVSEAEAALGAWDRRRRREEHEESQRRHREDEERRHREQQDAERIRRQDADDRARRAAEERRARDEERGRRRRARAELWGRVRDPVLVGGAGVGIAGAGAAVVAGASPAASAAIMVLGWVGGAAAGGWVGSRRR